MKDVINQLIEKRDALQAELVTIDAERDELSLAALTGDDKAEKKLKAITTKRVELTLHVENAESAIRHAQAKHAAQVEAERIDGLNQQVKDIVESSTGINSQAEKVATLNSLLFKETSKLIGMVRESVGSTNRVTNWGVITKRFGDQYDALQRGNTNIMLDVAHASFYRVEAEVKHLSDQGAERVAIERPQLDKTWRSKKHETRETTGELVELANNIVNGKTETATNTETPVTPEEKQTALKEMVEQQDVEITCKPLSEIRAELAEREAQKDELDEDEEALLANLLGGDE